MKNNEKGGLSHTMPLAHVTMPRVEAWVQSRDLNYKVDDDGDLAAGFDDVVMFVHVEENLLRTQGYWGGPFNPETDLQRVQEVANDLNKSVVIPKTCVIESRGLIVLEYSVYTGDGFTDEQLDNVLDNAFMATFRVAEELGTKLPDLAPEKEND